MASPSNTLKTSLFGQLKSYSNAVQGAFEQRIARPLLAFKRDFSRPTSESRVSSDYDSPLPQRTREESTSSSSPLEIIDIDTSGSIKSIFEKVKNTLSPSVKRRASENPTTDDKETPSRENRNSSISSLTKKDSHKHRLQNHKSVSFADSTDNERGSDTYPQYSNDDRDEIIRNAQTLADQILIASIHDAVLGTNTNALSKETNDGDFERDFHRTIKPRRVSIDNMEDLVYQDLSAEIVAYVLKHALRTLKKEHEESSLLAEKESIVNRNEEDEDFIDLK